MAYYDDLSAGNSDDNGSWQSEEEEEFVACDAELLLGRSKKQVLRDEPKFSTLETGLWSRAILHLDVDCFYCQCEEIDRDLRSETPMRPLAIGQKHIIVTCNYEARKYGVTKLQSREAAYQACPHLWIVEGSDLTKYRRHSRAIYEAFRQALAEIVKEVDMSIGAACKLPAKKGCMDEMMADLTQVVDLILNFGSQICKTIDADERSRFVFGEDIPSSVAVLVEDQTGEKSIVSFDPSSKSSCAQVSRLAPSRRNVHDICKATDLKKNEIMTRLKIAADVTDRVCRYILESTGFHTTGGISVSPLLAKLTSSLHKPKSVNVLYPWRSSQLLYSMPLRKMHNIGRGTVQALRNSISTLEVDNVKKQPMGTVLDLLEMPMSSIRKAVEGLSTFASSSQQLCDTMIQHCRGLDVSEVEDDEAQLSKTVSVENSFRRGSVSTLDAINHALDEICRRLPILLNDRASWAKDFKRAYPQTIRLTLRMVDSHLALTQKRRPYVTKSKQREFDGRTFLVGESNLDSQFSSIRNHVKPLLQDLVPDFIDITRINVAMTNFMDVRRTHVSELHSGQATLTKSFGKRKSTNCFKNQSDSKKLLKVEDKEFNVDLGNSQRLRTVSQTTRPNGKMKSTRIDHFFSKK